MRKKKKQLSLDLEIRRLDMKMIKGGRRKGPKRGRGPYSYSGNQCDNTKWTSETCSCDMGKHADLWCY